MEENVMEQTLKVKDVCEIIKLVAEGASRSFMGNKMGFFIHLLLNELNIDNKLLEIKLIESYRKGVIVNILDIKEKSKLLELFYKHKDDYDNQFKEK